MVGSKVNDILVFLAVVDAGNFVAGGKAFGLSRSTAGKAVARLESGYGVRLLNRTTRSLSLTEEGRNLYEHGQVIRSAVQAADASVADDLGAPRGTLRITAPDALGRKLLLPSVQKFLKKWPDIKIEISFSDRINNVIEDGFDLAIRVGLSSPAQGLISRTLLTDTSLFCAAPSYFQERTHPTSVEQLGFHDLLQFSSGGERQNWHLMDSDGLWSNAQGRVRLRLDSAEALREAALYGLGIALLPQRLVREDLAAGRLEHVLPQVKPGDVPIVILYPHKRFLEPRVRHFIDMLVEHQNNSPSS
ncbi:HTH-type transcriptional regulator DmlR [Pseudovibrio axinellae]|uniref:HTH-type transcriptional regulator DmlR n=1 Tax=Pseudovibrio axinellae TaxID=989403 RepID=A0A165W8D5_9HYPH|nr:LysR family transcriptional regulator [Pseudovibrio axinellae]KZL16158.1 HTH-type transcriptional regulator DmlR [Pseudovibrio axinellae]SER93719.1 DNA-binding transcriptional regulator, LysR family [Pseudovibrio axinellae]